MKLFSRTSLVALGTAAAITLSGVTAPAFADEDSNAAVSALKTAEDNTPEAPGASTPLKLEQPGTITGVPGKAITPVTVKVVAGEAESFTSDNLPSGLLIDNTGKITGTPKKEFTGSAKIIAKNEAGVEAEVYVNFDFNEEPSSEEPSSGSSDTDNIENWIKIITAVIGALTTILTFSTKLDSFLK
ncbi:putative Ig domain-containing protein [Corynebacterium glutamicum]|uniref:Uncharacterized protein Cgl1651/cg1859 n=1 Tax=Corynebacterium glutamicum (strain ATCC 13032 / DSM 20300 / JCM 1318 / BCRC 11384 / CCUG 27702 / LMG 3730 / NBRC 12168 / NCIMB 10025 / NRRL B-2784 / 534) TaxID=196627 RepID=Y1651_CORGL|nr:putative Ig domain-containing protein [Corynebacterium glutamicum]Q8NQ03.1 RecName: Full=Uncharacterized protein Cgl1651/cg1859; Flags: Precursor [Corynebacterium glutamicum ATCC 13032]BAB99044.1 Hypothetical protein [Corynebacterium glutamicum ATCC 13032]